MTITIKQYDPVAVVYYRCEMGGKHTPHKNLYYVHNALALEELTTNDKGELAKPTDGVRVGHVARWPHIDDVHICSEKGAANVVEAVEAVDKGKVTRYWGDTDSGGSGVWRLWVVSRVRAYSAARSPTPIAIAWMANNNAGDPHNGAFDCFQKPPPPTDRPCTDSERKIENAGGKGTLKFWRYEHKSAPDVRIADSPGEFTLQHSTPFPSGADFKIWPTRSVLPSW